MGNIQLDSLHIRTIDRDLKITFHSITLCNHLQQQTLLARTCFAAQCVHTCMCVCVMAFAARSCAMLD